MKNYEEKIRTNICLFRYNNEFIWQNDLFFVNWKNKRKT